MALDHSCQVQRHSLQDRKDDCYDTPPEAVHALLRVERLPKLIWEPACGKGNIVQVLRDAGHDVIAEDLNDRGCPASHSGRDFLLMRPCGELDYARGLKSPTIVTNPPFKLAEEFVEKALTFSDNVIMLLRLAFYESERRSPILDNGWLARIYAFRKRLPMMHRDGWEGKKANSGMAFAWFVWDKNHQGPTTIQRISWEDNRDALDTRMGSQT